MISHKNNVALISFQHDRLSSVTMDTLQSVRGGAQGGASDLFVDLKLKNETFSSEGDAPSNHVKAPSVSTNTESHLSLAQVCRLVPHLSVLSVRAAERLLHSVHPQLKLTHVLLVAGPLGQ